jgi:hypothetical protein
VSIAAVTSCVVISLCANVLPAVHDQQGVQQIIDEVQELFARADYELAHRRLDALIAAHGREVDGQQSTGQFLIEARERPTRARQPYRRP